MRRITKILSVALCLLLIFQQTGFSQVVGQLDMEGYLTSLHSNIAQDRFRPLHLRYLSYDFPSNTFNLLVDKGDLKKINQADLETNTQDLLDYFLIGVTIPNESFWVNLRPDAETNIIDDELAKTNIGKVMLEADVQLKKDTARYTSPETPEGKVYWDKLYKKAGEIFGSESITIPTLTRPWIVPDEVLVAETKDGAYIFKATLKVLLEQDYLKDSATYNFKDERLKQLNEYSSQLIRELIIPKLTQEVNSSQRYASLRQVYYSLILAQWFKAKFSGKAGRYASLIDRHNLSGLTSKTPWSKTTYFKQYQQSFKDGEYNLKEQVSSPFGQTIRSYFSGGIKLATSSPATNAFPMDTIPDNSNLSALQYDGNTRRIGGGITIPRPRFGHSGNEVDNQFIQAQQAILKGDVEGARRNVQEAIRLLREVDFEELDSSGFPVADTVNQAEVAIWVLGQLNENGVMGNDVAELLEQLRAGVNGLELKRMFGYQSSPPDDEPVIKDIEVALKQKSISGKCVITIEGVAGSGKNYVGNLIKRQGVGSFKSDDIGVIDTDDFLPRMVDDGIDRMLIGEDGSLFIPLNDWTNYCQFSKFESVFKSLSQKHRLVVVVGLFAPLFFQRSHLQNPDIRVLLKNSYELNRMRVIRRDGYPDKYIQSMEQCEKLQGLLQQPFDVVVTNGHKKSSDSKLNEHKADGFSFILPEIYGRVVEEVAWEVTPDTVLETLSNEVEDRAKSVFADKVDPLSHEVSNTEAVIAGVFSVIRHLFSVGELSIVITVRTFEKGVEVVIDGKNEQILPGKEAFADQSLLRPLRSHVPEIVITSPNDWYGRTIYRRWETAWITSAGSRYSFAIPTNIPSEHGIGYRGKDIDGDTGVSSKPTPSRGSSPIEENNGLGGIDFRTLPIVTTAINNLKAVNGKIPNLNLNSERQEIKRLVQSGISPSGERMKEYLQVSCYHGEILKDREQVISCISDILRQEEERYASTEPVLRDILVVLESGRSPQELKAIFTGFSPQAK